MIKIENLEVWGFRGAIRGMRNPMNSWNNNDSFTFNGEPNIGEKDLKLAQNLIKAGSEHSKFMRQIQVWADFNLPRYMWSEFDTYHFNTKNSCSTMHRLLHTTTSITKDLFSYSEEDDYLLDIIIRRLNQIRIEYINAVNESEKNKLIRRAKQILPEGFFQLRTVNTNYAELRNMVLQRKNHKLKEDWQNGFCKWVTTLPYAKELIFFGIEDEYNRLK